MSHPTASTAVGKQSFMFQRFTLRFVLRFRERKSADDELDELNRSMGELSIQGDGDGDDADIDDLNRQMGALTIQDDDDSRHGSSQRNGGGQVDNVVHQFLDHGVDPRSSKAFGHRTLI